MLMSEIYTNWTKATTNPYKAVASVMSCIDAGYCAWIEIRPNGQQQIPIKRKNPVLDDPFQWTMNYGVPRTETALNDLTYFNETEKDLTHNWIACFGEANAIKAYQTEHKISAGLFTGTGICHPVRIKDAESYYKSIGRSVNAQFWMTVWKPIDGVERNIIDERIGDVFTICYTKDSMDKTKLYENAGKFLLDYAAHLNEKGTK